MSNPRRPRVPVFTCPKCQCSAIRVVDSRGFAARDGIRRRRECEKCGHRFTTYEIPANELNTHN